MGAVTQQHPSDESPIAATQMFQKFVDEEPAASAGPVRNPRTVALIAGAIALIAAIVAVIIFIL